jgi:hypothetical protein
VSSAEVELSELDPSSTDALTLSQRLAARQPGTDTWRGFSVTSPFLPGKLASVFETRQLDRRAAASEQRCLVDNVCRRKRRQLRGTPLLPKWLTAVWFVKVQL